MPRPPATWTKQELADDAATARQLFVSQRMASMNAERERYETEAERYTHRYLALLDKTSDLEAASFTGAALRDRELMDAARYMAVPPISAGDLDTLTDAAFGAWLKQTTDKGSSPSEEQFDAAAALIRSRMGEARAPWLADARRPTDEERLTFARWSATIPATQTVLTARRTEASKRQETAIRAAATAAGYVAVKPKGVALSKPETDMEPGTFADAARNIGQASCDVPIRLIDGHPTGLKFLAIEAKVSNTAVNSRKRLLEASRKREVWDNSGLLYSFRSGAVMSGVFSHSRLVEAQEAGLFLWWEHRLEDLTAFLAG